MGIIYGKILLPRLAAAVVVGFGGVAVIFSTSYSFRYLECPGPRARGDDLCALSTVCW